MNTTFRKLKPKIISNMKYKHFSNDTVKSSRRVITKFEF